MTQLLLLSSTIALASFGPNVRIDHDDRPNRSCINGTITIGPGAPSSQPIYVAFEDDSMVGIFNVHSDIMFQKSTDAGRTWLSTDLLIQRGASHAYAPDITTDSDGNVYIVWGNWYVDTAGVYDRRNLCVRSSDGGTTWTAPVRVDDRLDSTRGIGDPLIAADSAGDLLCAWNDKRTGSYHVWSSVSTDRGATWSRNVKVCDDTTDYDCAASDVFIQPGTNHYLVAAKVHHRMKGRIIGCVYLYRSTDMGLTFQPGVQLDTFNDYATHPHVVADRDHIICDYFGDGFTVPTLDTIIAEARTFYTQADSWGTPARMTNLDSVHELYLSGPLALSGDGRVHTALAVQDTVDHCDNMYYTCSSDHGVSWSDLEIVSDDTTVESWYPDIGADSTGHAYIVWYQPNASRGEIWFATNHPAAIAERPLQQPIGAQPSATVIRGVLFLPAASGVELEASSVLLDIGGRKVLDLQPGANDVRALAPGVYFVRSEPSAVSREPSAVTKVVVTR